MHPKVLLDVGSRLVHRILLLAHPADAVVAQFFRDNHGLGPRERLILSDTVYAVLRRKLLFEHWASSGHGPQARRMTLLGFAGPRDLLRLAVSESESAWLNQCQAVDVAALPAPCRHNLPPWLAQALQAQVGDDFWPLVESLYLPADLAVRVNGLQAKRAQVQAELAQLGIQSVPLPYAPWGLRITGKPALGKTAAFLRGAIEVQDEGAQLLAALLDAKRGEMVVDFCAGAGGKTLAIGADMRNTGRLYAFDTQGHRLQALQPRLARSGLSNVYPMVIAHAHDERVMRLHGKADRVLVDAPCSGLGTLRRHPDLKWRQDEAALARMSVQQAAILQSAARLLKPGGRLVYATCSVLQQENEAVAKAFTQANADFTPLDAHDALTGLAQAAHLCSGGASGRQFLHLWPHRHQTDGFFAAVWQRARSG